MIQMRLLSPLYDGEYNPDEYIAKSAPFLARSSPTIWRAKAPQTDWRQKTSQTASIIQKFWGQIAAAEVQLKCKDDIRNYSI